MGEREGHTEHNERRRRRRRRGDGGALGESRPRVARASREGHSEHFFAPGRQMIEMWFGSDCGTREGASKPGEEPTTTTTAAAACAACGPQGALAPCRAAPTSTHCYIGEISDAKSGAHPPPMASSQNAAPRRSPLALLPPKVPILRAGVERRRH